MTVAALPSPLTREQSLHMGIAATWIASRCQGDEVEFSALEAAHQCRLGVRDLKEAVARLAVRDVVVLIKRADVFSVRPRAGLERWVRVYAEDCLSKRVSS